MTDYYYLPKLPKENVDKLIALRERFTDKFYLNRSCRPGKGGISKYTELKWMKWKEKERLEFCVLQPNGADTALTGYFIEFKANDNFLAYNTTWVGEAMAGTIIAYALYDQQAIYLNDKPISLGAGEGIVFSLSVPHEVKSSNREALWANYMVIHKPEYYITEKSQ